MNLDYGYLQFSETDGENLIKLAQSLVYKEAPLFVELGCWAGKSTSYLADFVKSINGKLIVVDTFLGSETTKLTEFASNKDIKELFINNMNKLGLMDIIEIIQCDTVEASKFINNDSIDYIFIDADHRYKEIKSDINAWLPKCKKGAIICGHDFESFDFEESLIELDYATGKHHGVIKAVTETFPEVKQLGNIWHTIKQ